MESMRENPRKDVVLLALSALEEMKMLPIGEHGLHDLVKRLQKLNPTFRFPRAPIVFSFDLCDFLTYLDRTRFVDDMVLRRDGWVPWHEYTLSGVGRAEVLDIRDRYRIKAPQFLDTLAQTVKEFAVSYIPPVDISPPHYRSL